MKTIWMVYTRLPRNLKLLLGGKLVLWHFVSLWEKFEATLLLWDESRTTLCQGLMPHNNYYSSTSYWRLLGYTFVVYSLTLVDQCNIPFPCLKPLHLSSTLCPIVRHSWVVSVPHSSEHEQCCCLVWHPVLLSAWHPHIGIDPWLYFHCHVP